MLPVYPFVGLLVKTSIRNFFTNIQPCYITWLICKLPVHCHDVCNINPPFHISVNCVEILLNIIRSNVHKTVVSYKNVQSFCSDVVVQNVNVISSPICKVFCFKKHHCVSQIKCFTLFTSLFAVNNKITFIINSITTIITIIIIIFNFNITIIIIIIIIITTIIIKSTIVIIILSFVLLFFDIRSSCVTVIFEFICVLFDYLFFITYWL